MKYTYKTAVKTDMPQLRKFRDELFLEEEIKKNVRFQTDESFNELLNYPNQILMVLDDEKLIAIGAIEFPKNNRLDYWYKEMPYQDLRFCYLRFCLILKEYRGQGTGKEILKTLRTLASLKEGSQVMYCTIKTENTNSIKLFEKFGFVYHITAETSYGERNLYYYLIDKDN